MLPLEGITVVSLEQAVAAPFTTRQLADLGARVIKIERPGVGDFARGYDQTVLGQSSHFVWLNRSKESLTLDVKHPSAGEVLWRLIARADVFVQNLVPGAAARLGLSSDELLGRNPRLVVCNISGYGPDGPYSLKKAYDLLIQCESGVVSVTGTPETPSKAGISIADIAAGMYGYTGILTGLYQREKTGHGTAFDVSMFEALGEWMGYPAYFANYGGTPPPRTGAAHATIHPYGPFPAGDGKTVFLGIQNEREWASFCASVLERPELATDARFDSNSRRVANREALTAIIVSAFSRLSARQVLDRLELAQIASARLNDMKEFWAHPQLQARRRWRSVDTPNGTIRALVPPVTMRHVEYRMDPVPAVGQHTQAILRELGFDQAFISRLATENAI
ncbi:MAG TPA: CaiB/BaiF CoA-transferase family protein [Burkholderiales bacterium]|jgi:itaconate CoA-transferase|nr:CaiB/BaiF CoA-transferase family protein [Burkholderiales bacterium]